MLWGAFSLPSRSGDDRWSRDDRFRLELPADRGVPDPSSGLRLGGGGGGGGGGGALEGDFQPELDVGSHGIVPSPAVAERADDQRPVLRLRPPRRGRLRVLEHGLHFGDTLEPTRRV